MLYYDFVSVIHARGVEKPYAWLVKKGFTHHMASRISMNDVKQFSLKHMEQLCEVLGCAPHDLMVWRPNTEKEDVESNPLQALRRRHKPTNIKQLMSQLSLKEIKDLEQALQQKRNGIK